MKKIFLLAVSITAGLFAFSQGKVQTRLSGLVTDARNGLPLAGASVYIFDSPTGTITDSLGRYVLRNLPVGHTIIEVSHTGYKTLVEHLDIHPDEEHNFLLAPSMLENEVVTVTAVANATSIRKACR